MAQKKVLFIINPISGGKNKERLPDLIHRTIDKKKFQVDIVFTERPGHAAELAAEGLHDWYIAVGGDGTINEVASSLIQSAKSMGILPMGSGNGLARHVGISMNIGKAIAQLNTAKEMRIDTCSVNGKPYVNMAGVGFDAHIGKMFAESVERGFKTYVVQTLTEFQAYQPQQYKIKANNQELTEKAFLISLANSSQYGNNAYIAPKAELTDGMLNICLLRPFKPYHVPGIGLRIFNKSIERSKFYKTLLAKELVIERDQEGVAHLDGEPMHFGKRLEIKVVPASLTLLVP